MKPDKTWSLFLDRDGVINRELRNEYVKTWNEFTFEEGALDALKKLNTIFGHIFIVTNQRGVGAGIMSLADLDAIHQIMLEEIIDHGGRIDEIYFASDEDRESKNRKPHPTMGIKAKSDFPLVDFSKSMMVGNSISDMEFGRNLEMYNVFIDEKKKYSGIKTEAMDAIYNSLKEFSDTL